MLSRAPKFTRGMITLAIRAEVPPAYHSHTLLLTFGEKEWGKVLDVKEEDAAYVAICSPSGEIQWQTKGVGEEQFAALRAHLHADEIQLADNRRGEAHDFEMSSSCSSRPGTGIITRDDDDKSRDPAA